MPSLFSQNNLVELAGQALTLLPDRALFWPDRQTLIVADLHLGQAAHFHAAAIPVPGDLTGNDLTRLSRIMTQTEARRLIVLGDLIHAKAGRTEAVLNAIATWRERHVGLEIVLIRGNHDRHAGDPSADWRITTVNEPLIESPFAFCHYPEITRQGYTLAGHLHPAVVLNGPGWQREKLPCFYFGARVGILPAFGSFTGTSLIKALPSDRVYMVAETQIIPIGSR